MLRPVWNVRGYFRNWRLSAGNSRFFHTIFYERLGGNMKDFITMMQCFFAAMGGALGAVLGGWDGFLYAIDSLVIQNGNVIRTAVIFFYLSNEGISILENVALMGLPVPQKLRDVLEQLKNHREEE